MNFGQAISTCFHKYTDFSGRAQRSEFWQWFLFCVLGVLIALILDYTILGPTRPKLFFSIFFIVTLFPTVTAVARRLHDIGDSGWWQIIPFIVLLCLVFLDEMNILRLDAITFFAVIIFSTLPIIGWLAIKGTQGDNRFGPNPLDDPLAEEKEA